MTYKEVAKMMKTAQQSSTKSMSDKLKDSNTSTKTGPHNTPAASESLVDRGKNLYNKVKDDKIVREYTQKIDRIRADNPGMAELFDSGIDAAERFFQRRRSSTQKSESK